MKKFIAIILAVITVFSMTVSVAAYGEKTNIDPDDYAKTYTPTKWAQEASDAAELTWYESSKRDVEKGEFMLAFLRMIQASRVRRGLDPLESEAPLDFHDEDELSDEAYEEARILVELGVLSGYQGYMNLDNSIKRSEAAKVMAYFNSEMELPAYRGVPNFVDIGGHWAEANIIYCYRIGLVNGKGTNSKGMIFEPDAKLTVEELQQILYNIAEEAEDFTLEDMATAMVETFKVTTGLDVETASLTDSVIYLNVGDKITYTAKDNDGYWTTSNSSVVKVTSKGAITAKSAGKAIVTNGDIAFEVNVGKATTYISVGDTVELSSTSSSKWTSSNKKVATVNKNGEVTGVAEGTVTISRGTAESYEVTVVPQNVIELAIGDTISIGSSRYGKWASDNTSVATVSSSGTVKAVNEGSAIVKNKIASYCIVVKPNSSVELNIGDTILFNIEADGEWETSKSKIASVSEDGLVKALREGTSVITCGDFSIEVNVGGSYSDSYTMAVGDTMIIGNGKYDSSWESSNTRVASVNNYGKVTAKKLGRVTISNDDFDYTVTVVDEDEDYEYTLIVGESVTLGDGEYDSSWESDDEKIATVTKYGKVRAKSAGTAIIYNDYDEYIIVVEDDDDSSDEEYEYSLEVGESITLGDGEYDSSWESEDSSIATVTRYGKVTAKKAGTVIIYNDYDEYIITVKKAVVDEPSDGDNDTDTDAYTKTRVYAEGYEPSTYYNAWVGDTIKVIVESADGELEDISLSNSKCEITKDISSLGNSKYTFTVTAKTAGACVITLDFADGEFEYTINSYKE